MNGIIYLIAMVIVTIAIAILGKTIVKNDRKHKQAILHLDKERTALKSKIIIQETKYKTIQLEIDKLKSEVEELKKQVLKYMPVEDFITLIEDEVQRQKQLTEEANDNKN